jgi:hypothetical protein
MSLIDQSFNRNVLDPYGSRFHTGVNGGSNGAAEGVPRHVIEPSRERTCELHAEIDTVKVCVWVCACQVIGV